MAKKEISTSGISFRCTSAEQKVFKEVAESMALSMSAMFKYLAFSYAKENKLQTYTALFPQVKTKDTTPPPQFPRSNMKTEFMKDEETARRITELMDDPPSPYTDADIVEQYGCDLYDLNADWNTYRSYRFDYKTYHNIPLTELDISANMGPQPGQQQPMHHTPQKADAIDDADLDSLFDV